jgi:WD40 repeat protein/predicted transcriptional regulator
VQRQRRKRGVVLSSVGLKKLQEARYQAEVEENERNRYTIEELSDRTQLAPFTVAKVLAAEEGVDKQTLVLFFRAFNLELDKADYSRPNSNCEQPESVTLGDTHTDWGEAIDVSVFYGRTDELAKLEYWILHDSCRLIALVGMGGIGKTALSVKLAEQIQDNFEFVIWRSLRNAPPLKEILANWIEFFSNTEATNLSDNIGHRISQLIDYLRSSRCLLVLDNVESILGSGDHVGRYREGYEDYGELFRRVGEASHQSCLILTTREKPKEVASLEGSSLPIRSLPLLGLNPIEGQEIFRSQNYFLGSESDWQTLINRYAGNPLALRIIATTVKELFNSNISEFLAQGTTVFGDIRDLLDQHFYRLSPLEKEVMYWLTLNREPVSITELREDIVAPISQAKLLEALESLFRRSLIEKATLLEKSGVLFTLQPVVMEYLTEQFIEQVSEEIISDVETQPISSIQLFKNYALIKATAKDYVRHTQVRLILKPIIDKLLYLLGGKNNVKNKLTQILAKLREKSPIETGYVGGNALNLMSQLQIDLRELDFSHLTIWQAYLSEVDLHRVNFAYSDLSNSVFAESLESIVSVTFSPDGKLLATGDTSGDIYLWGVADSKKLSSFQGHAGSIQSVAFSPDGKILASGSYDHTVRLWEVSTGQCLNILEGHARWIWSVAFSPDGKTLASGAVDSTIRLWDVATGECLNVLQEDSEAMLSVAFSPDGKTLARSSTGHNVRLWDIIAGRCLKVCQGHTSWVWSVAFSPDGKTVASASEDHTVRIWDAVTGECVRICQGHANWVWSVAFSPDGQLLASGSVDHTVKLWDASTGQCVKTLQGHISWIWSVAFAPKRQGDSPDGYILASSSIDRTVKLWDVATGRCVRTLQGRGRWVKSLAWHPQGQILASGSFDQGVRLWNAVTGQCIKLLQGHTHVLSVCYSPTSPYPPYQGGQGGILASGSYDQTVKLWDTNTGECLKTLQGLGGAVWSVAFSPDGQILATGSDRIVKLWDVTTGQCVKTLLGHSDMVFSVSFSPDGTMLASGSEDQTARLWDIETGQCLHDLDEHISWVQAVAFSPDGRTLASGCADQTIKLWDVATGRCIKTWEEDLHGYSIWSIAFSPDGQLLASAGTDEMVRLWDVKEDSCFTVLQGHRHGLLSLAFSPDGQTLASGSRDDTIMLWNYKTGECLQTLRADRPYEGMNITGITGLTEVAIATLKALGAVESVTG